MRRYSLHGKRHSRTYTIWCGIIARCLNPNNAAYANYGGRGITVCARWREFIGFYEDMGDPPPGRSIERINNDLGYEPGNCRWATRLEQNRNRRNLRLVTIGDETLCLSEWAERNGVRIGTISQRLKNGWPPEVAVTAAPVTERKGKPRGYRWSDPELPVTRAMRGLTIEQIDIIRHTPVAYGSGRLLARQFGVSDCAISAVRKAIRAGNFNGQGGGDAKNVSAEAA